MIGIEEARRLLFEQVRSRREAWPAESVMLPEAIGRIVSESEFSSICVPRFDNSAMDGFAIRSETTKPATKESPVKLKVVGTAAVGEKAPALRDGRTALKIMTGAPIPEGADAVIPKEETREREGVIEILEPVPIGCFVRRKAEDIQEGDEVVKRGTTVTVGVSGLLASIGVKAPLVARKARVSIIVTGRELVSDPKKLEPGKILDANSILLQAGLRQIACEVRRIKLMGDDPALLRKETHAALEESDVVLISGGVSIGDSDYTREAMRALGVQEIFWGVRQKPGKPLYAGFKDDKVVLGLPGNPFSTFVCFFLYVRPMLLTMMGAVEPDLHRVKLHLAADVKQTPERAQLLKGRVISSTSGECLAEPLGRQASHLLSSLKEADILILIPEGDSKIPRGAQVEVFALPR
ncbi:MAG: gephyrin-like molybdotransferase Glp [Pseudomonadota bacterium]